MSDLLAARVRTFHLQLDGSSGEGGLNRSHPRASLYSRPRLGISPRATVRVRWLGSAQCQSFAPLFSRPEGLDRIGHLVRSAQLLLPYRARLGRGAGRRRGIALVEAKGRAAAQANPGKFPSAKNLDQAFLCPYRRVRASIFPPVPGLGSPTTITGRVGHGW